jgi:hypothetical protein
MKEKITIESQYKFKKLKKEDLKMLYEIAESRSEIQSELFMAHDNEIWRKIMKKNKEFDVILMNFYLVIALIIGGFIFKTFYTTAAIVAPVFFILGMGTAIWFQKFKIYMKGHIRVIPQKKKKQHDAI